MRRLLLSGLAGLVVLAAAAQPAEARRGGGGHGGGHWGGSHGGGGYRGGHWSGRSPGWSRPGLGWGVGIGLGTALAYRGWWGGYPGYVQGYGSPYPYAPLYPPPVYPLTPLPPVAALGVPGKAAPVEARTCRAVMQVSCRLTQPTPVGGACGCVSNMGMLPGEAAP